MFKKVISLLTVVALMCSLSACQPADDKDAKTIQAAQVPVDAYMTAFCKLDLKAMAEETDAQVDYSQIAFLSLDELKDRMLVPFATFEALGISTDEFQEIVDEIFSAYESYASYKITNAQIQGDTVVFTVDVEYVSLVIMTELLDTAIAKIDMEDLESEIMLAVMGGGFMMMLGDGSMTDIIKAAIAPVIENLKVELTRSIAELTPQKGSITLVAVNTNNEWVISDSQSDVSFLGKVFE